MECSGDRAKSTEDESKAKRVIDGLATFRDDAAESGKGASLGGAARGKS